MVKRISSGVDGLDELIEGGFPKESIVLVSGSPGTGKTIMGLQFLVEGAENNEPGIYVTFEESKKDIVSQGEGFGWDLKKLEDEDKLRINSEKPKNLKQVIKKIQEEKDEINAQRLVLDSLSTVGIYATTLVDRDSIEFSDILSDEVKVSQPIIGEAFTRRAIHSIIEKIKEMGLTSILTSELAKDSNYLSRDTVSEFASDGVLVLTKTSIGDEEQRTLVVEKMRSTEIDGGTHIINFMDRGIKISE